MLPFIFKLVTYFPNYVTHRPKWRLSCIFFDLVVSNNLHNYHEIILWHKPNSVDRVLSIFAGCNIRLSHPGYIYIQKVSNPVIQAKKWAQLGVNPKMPQEWHKNNLVCPGYILCKIINFQCPGYRHTVMAQNWALFQVINDQSCDNHIKVGVNHGIFHVYHFWNFLIFKCTWVCSSSSSKNKSIFLNLSINSINLKMSIYLSISKMCSFLFRGEIKLARV